MDSQYRWEISAPEGWRIIVRVNSTRNFKFEAGNINSGGDASFNSVEDRNFPGVDEFLSITNMIWIKASINRDRLSDVPSGFNETFGIVVRAVKVKGSLFHPNL